MKISKAKLEMFNFTTTLYYHSHCINKKTGIVSIYVRVYISSSGHYEEDYFPLNIKWHHEQVDKKSCKLIAKNKEEAFKANDYDMMITKYRSKLNDVAIKYRLADRYLTIDALKRELILNDSSKSMYGYCTFRTKELFNKGEIEDRTRKNQNTTARRILEFDATVRIDQITVKWMQSFKKFLQNLDNKPNTIWTRIKDIKCMLGYASKEVRIWVDPDAVNFENKYTEPPVVFLVRPELQRLLNLIRSGFIQPEDLVVLKAFLFSCFTSLRISDLYEANTTWMISENFLLFTMKKNRRKKPKTIKIPIAPIAKLFIEQTVGKFFTLPSQQEYNRRLKNIAHLAGIKKNLSSHVGRHTFGYLFMTSVGNIYALKEIMGHTKIETTQRYAHLDEDYKLEVIQKIQEGFNTFAVS